MDNASALTIPHIHFQLTVAKPMFEYVPDSKQNPHEWNKYENGLDKIKYNR